MQTPQDRERLIELATRLGWPQDDPDGALNFNVKHEGLVPFAPDHNEKDVGLLIERLHALGLREFHFEPLASGRVRAYFGQEQWAEEDANWKSATMRAALRALRERKIGDNLVAALRR
jgi:hypothetical protein